jgi:hypothetical protein
VPQELINEPAAVTQFSIKGQPHLKDFSADNAPVVVKLAIVIEIVTPEFSKGAIALFAERIVNELLKFHER